MNPRPILLHKLIGEVIPADFYFTENMSPSQTIISAVVTVQIESGGADTSTNLLYGDPSISGSRVRQQIMLGTIGASYKIICSATTSNGQILVREALLTVGRGIADMYPFDQDDGGPNFPINPGPPIGPDVSGDAPNGFPGVQYYFEYPIDGGTPPFTVTLTGGALPNGLSMEVVGDEVQLTGLPFLNGLDTESFSWQFRVTDANGLYDDHTDSADILAFAWIMIGAAAGKMYVSNNLADWTDAIELDRDPYIEPVFSSVSTGGYYQISDNRLMTFNADGEVEILEIAGFSNPMPTTVTTEFPDYGGAYQLDVINGVPFVYYGNSNSASYFYTLDAGDSWQSGTLPALRFDGIGYMQSRWAVPAHAGSSEGFYYSIDPDAPTSWFAGTGAVGQIFGRVMQLEFKLLAWGGGSGASPYIYETTNGKDWTLLTTSVSGYSPNSPNGGCYATDGNDFIICGDTNQSWLVRTFDGGDTWEGILFRNTRRLEIYAGLLVAMCPGTGGGVFYSPDFGTTWTEIIYPPGVGPGFYTTLFVTPYQEGGV